MTDIKHVIFDLGGVIYDIDYKLTVKSFQSLLSADTILRQGIIDSIFKMSFVHDYEKGLISTSEFRSEIQNHFHFTVNDEDFDNAWNALLIKMNQTSVNLIKKLRGKYTITLLSNTNELHFNGIIEEFRLIQEYFNHIFFSHIVGARKPEIEIFQLAINTLNANPNQILFIDDMEENINGAKAAGLLTYHFTSIDCIVELNNLLFLTET
jgi:putative hydrolase of the HAD superfamily